MKKAILTLAILFPVYAHSGAIVDGREWRQLTDTVNISWDQVLTVCDWNSTSCSGSVDGVDFSGWNLATEDDVKGLFNFFIPGVANDFGPGDFLLDLPTNSVALDLFSAVFDFTYTYPNQIQWTWYGMYKHLANLPGADARNTIVLDTLHPNQGGEYFSFQGQLHSDIALPYVGTWLVRSPNQNPVSEPGTIGLLSLDLLVLNMARRRYSYQSNSPFCI